MGGSKVKMLSVKEKESTRRMYPSDKDKRAVLFCAEQGFATVDHLWKIAWGDQKTSSYAYERLLLLERNGFLKSIKMPNSAIKVYRPTIQGRHFVSHLSEVPLPLSDIPVSMALHQLDLNDVRIAIERAGGQLWRSSESLAVDPTFKKLGARHTPDGLYLSTKGILTAVEYDRTLRKKERIRERFQDYLAELMSPDRSFERLVYLVSPSMKIVYEHIFNEIMSPVKSRALLITLPRFMEAVLGDNNGK